MPTFDVDATQLTVFRVDDEYLFTHYFENQALFDELGTYYDEEAYHFAIPVDEFEQVRDTLEDAYYDPIVVDELEPYCVVTGKYDEHADILKRSVLTWERRQHRFFLMKDELAVDEALERGATRLVDTEFALGL